VNDSWKADVDCACAVVYVDDEPVGTSVLITHNIALTCAHVITEQQSTTQSLQITASPIQLKFRDRVVELDSRHDVLIPDGRYLFQDDDAVDVAILMIPQSENPLPQPVSVSPLYGNPNQASLLGYPDVDYTRRGWWRDFYVRGSVSGLVQLEPIGVYGSLPGDSGGPVFDESGRLVGLLQEGSTRLNISRYIPIRRIASVWPECPIPWYFASDEIRSKAEDQAWGRRGGRPIDDLFCGRDRALKKIRMWINSPEDPGEALVITGQPGAGKSAVLCHSALAIEPLYPGLGFFFDAHDKTYAEFRRELIQFIGSTTTNDGAESMSLPLSHLPDRLFIFVDALNEASSRQDRYRLATELNDLAKRKGIRIIVATRPLTMSTKPLAIGSNFETEGLLFLLGVTSPQATNFIDLDSEAFNDPEAVKQYVYTILTHDPGIPDGAWTYYQQHPELTASLAGIIAEKADGNFLIAALSAVPLAKQYHYLNPHDWNDLQSIPSSLNDALYMSLNSEDMSKEERLINQILLTALAYAKGEGITDDLWLSFAKAISGRDFVEYDLARLRNSPVVDFLFETMPDAGSKVTRLFHESLADQFLPDNRDRNQDLAIWRVILANAETPHGWAATDYYTRTYATEYAVEAGEFPRLLNGPNILDFVVGTDPDRLVSAITSMPPGERPLVAHVVLQAAPRLLGPNAQRRASILSLTAAQLGLSSLAKDFHALSGTRMHIRWAHSRGPAHQSLTGTTRPARSVVATGQIDERGVIVARGADGSICSWNDSGRLFLKFPISHGSSGGPMATGHFYGNDVIISGGTGGLVRIWDYAGNLIKELATGHDGSIVTVASGYFGEYEAIVCADSDGLVSIWNSQAANPIDVINEDMSIHVSRVKSIAIGLIYDDVIIASGHDDGTVYMWNGNGTHISTFPTNPDSSLRSVAIGHFGDRDVIVTGSDDGLVCVWDYTGSRVRPPLPGNTGSINSVAIGGSGPRSMIVSGSADGSICIWDGAGSLISKFPTGFAQVNSVVIGSFDDRDVIISSSTDGSVDMWDLTAALIGNHARQGHTHQVTTVAIGNYSTLNVVVSGSRDGSVCAWDLSTGDILGNPFIPAAVYAPQVTSVAVGRFTDRSIIAAGNTSGSVDIWDLLTGIHLHKLPTSHILQVISVAVGHFSGQDSIVTGSSDGAVHVWNYLSGHYINNPLPKHTGWVTSVAIGHLNGQEVIVTGSSDGSIRVWDETRRQIDNPLTGYPGGVTSVAIGQLNDHEVVITGSRDGSVRVWDRTQDLVVNLNTGHSQPVSTVAIGRFGTNDVVISGSWDGSVRLCDMSGALIDKPIEFYDPVRGVTISDQGFVVAAGIALVSVGFDSQSTHLEKLPLIAE